MNLKYDKTLGYYYFLQNGKKIYHHRYVAEQIIGRKLNRDEVVHHKDHIRTNNTVENLLVFRTEKDHALHHAYKNIELIKHDDNTYSFPINMIEKICINCGEKIKSHNEIFCSRKCHHDYGSDGMARNISYDVLKEDIRTMSFVALGKKYGVSDNAVRKWCVFHNLPRTLKEKKEFFKNTPSSSIG